MKKLFNIALALIASATVSTFALSPKEVNARGIETALLADSVDSYYSKVNTSSGSSLQASLTDIIRPHKEVGYDGLWNVYKDSDEDPKHPGCYWDMYSNYHFKFGTGSSYKKEGDGINREHSVPQSWFSKKNPMKCDAFHVYPTDGYVNNRRGSFLYGETNNPTYTSGNGSKVGKSSFDGYSGTVFEPIDEYKGDFARTYFYMATCYAKECGSWGGGVFTSTYPHLNTYNLNLFTKWSAEDPVSEKEINRNNAVYKHQNNRNPFIDHPEWIDVIFESKYTNQEADQEKVNAVILKISALPKNITLEDETLVNQAKAAYIALNTKEKGLVTNYDTLKAAEAKIAELKGSVVIPEPEPDKALTVKQARDIINDLTAGAKTSEKYKVTGTITGNIEEYQEKFGNATFDMNDGGSTDNITVFRSKDSGGVNFTASSFASKVAVGKVITIEGYLQKYSDKSGKVSFEITNGAVVETLTPVTPVEPEDPDQPDNPEPVNPTPTPQKEEVVISLDGISVESYQKNFAFDVDDYGFKASVCTANEQYFGGLRIGANKSNSTAIPSQFGISGKGGSLEFTTDIAGAIGIEYKISDKAQMTGKGSVWQILTSVDGGATWKKVAGGKDAEKDTLAATLSESLDNVRFAFVIQGDTARIDLGSIKIKCNAKSPKVVLSDTRTNAYLDISYTMDGDEVKSAELKTVIVSHVDLKYNVSDAEYGVIYTAKNNASKLIRKLYQTGNATAFAKALSGVYVKATVNATENDLVISAEADLEFETDYVAVVVCMQNGELVFANQAEINNKAMVEYYLNGIVTDQEQIKVLEYLIK